MAAIPTSVCAASDSLTAGVSKVAAGVMALNVQTQAINLASYTDLTLVLAGLALFLLPVIFGSKWISTVTLILSLLFGIAGASFLVETQEDSAALVDGTPPCT